MGGLITLIVDILYVLTAVIAVAGAAAFIIIFIVEWNDR